MIGSKAALGFPLLCALALCAFAAQDASAASAKNVTIFRCVEGATKDFSDAHCDTSVPAGTGKFGHEEVSLSPIAYIRSNLAVKNSTKESSNTVLKGTVFGVKIEIVCKTVSGEGSLTNTEPSSKVHFLDVLADLWDLFECTIHKPALGCKVKEPIAFELTGEAVEELGSGKDEMGVRYEPSGEHFAQVVLEGCLIQGTYNLDGTAIATGNTSNTGKFGGATLVFTNAMTKETLKLAGNSAELESTTTIKDTSSRPLVPTTRT
jgi:hypothetical protein